MELIRFILWIIIACALAWLLLPIIGFGLLFVVGLIAVLFVISFISQLINGNRGGFSFRTFTVRRSPREKADAAKAEQNEEFDAEYGEESGEIVELPPSALHKE